MNLIKIEDKDKFLKKNNYLGLFYFTTHVGMIFFLFFLILDNSNTYFFIFSYLFLGLLCSFTGTTGMTHEFYHNTVFTNKSVNQIIYKTLCVFNLLNYEYNSVSHKNHHMHNSYDEMDSEKTIEKITFLDLFFLFTINLPSLLSRLKYLILNSLNIFPKGLINNNIGPNLQLKIKNVARIILIVHISILTFFFKYLNFYYYLLLFIAPFTFNIFSNMISRAQHYQLEKNTNDSFRNTRTLRMNFFLEFLNWNMNYHIEHHINPAIPFYNLPKFNKFLRKKYEKDIIYLNSFDKEGIFKFIILILRDNFLLKKFG